MRGTPLGVLVLVYMINFIDRQILSILANDYKGRPWAEGRPAGLSLRDRLCDLLCPVRGSAGAARRRLAPHTIAEHRG